MRISREQGLLGRDCQIPARFIRDDMKALDFRAVKLYLYLHLLTLEGEGVVHEDALCRELSCRQSELREAVTALLRAGLIAAHENRLELCDYHRIQLEKELRRIEPETREQRAGSEEERRKNAVIRQINDTFFQGNMPFYFYHSIDSWFSRYGFEPEVVYALVREAARGNGLQSSSYADAIARSWSAKGVRSFSDLNLMSERYRKEKRTEEMVSKKLGIGRLNDYQKQAVNRWSGEWQFADDAIDEALRRASLNGKPSFQYIEAILREWHEASLSGLDDILRYEESRRTPNASSKTQAAGSIGNFKQREYSDEELDSLVYVPGFEYAGDETGGERP